MFCRLKLLRPGAVLQAKTNKQRGKAKAVEVRKVEKKKERKDRWNQ